MLYFVEDLFSSVWEFVSCMGDVSCEFSMVKNLVHWCHIFEVLELQPQKRAKRSNIGLWG